MLNNLKRKILVNIVSPLLRTFGFYIPPIPGVCGIITKRGEILVVDLYHQDGYALPGGGVQPDDRSLEDALRREIKEETNLEVKNLNYRNSIVTKMKNYSTVTCFYEVKIKGLKTTTIKESEEGKPLWMGPRKAYEKMVDEDCKRALRRYFDI
jgi:ADP-ribose pyrophosphatase YjhB (NUDIX family)